MTGSQLIYLIAVVVAAVALDLLLMAWARRQLKTRDSNRLVRVFGMPSVLATAARAGWRGLGAAPRRIAGWARGLDTAGLIGLRNLLGGLALLAAGLWIVRQPGGWELAASKYLNTRLFLQLGNLDNILISLPFLIAGCTLTLWALRRADRPTAEANPGGLRSDALALRLLQPHLAWILVGAVAFAFFLIQVRTLDYGALMPWLWLLFLALAAALAYTWDRAAGIPTGPGLARRDVLWMLALTLIGLLAASYRLQAVPNYLIGDEGSCWEAARDFATGLSRPPIFGSGVYTFPILSSIVQGWALRIFGVTLWGWRFGSVLAGVAAVPPLYLLAREMFDRSVAVVAGLVMVAEPYFLAFARLGYMNSQTIFVVTLALYWFYLGFKRSSALYLFLAGCAAGLGYYTYTAARSALMILAIFLFIGLLLHLRRGGVWIKAGLVFGAGWLLVAAPYLAYVAGRNPEVMQYKIYESIFINSYWGRQFYSDAQLYALAPPIPAGKFELFFNPGIYLVLTVRGVIRTLLAFVQPFLVTEHFIASPLAGPVGVGFFVVGACLAAAGLRQRRYALLSLWLVFTWIFLSAINTFPPRQTHMLGLIPAMALLTAVGIVRLADAAGSLLKAGPRGRGALIALALAATSFTGLYNYYVSMPTVYYPNLEAIIGWSGLYSNDERIVYAYRDPQASDFKPYVLREIRQDVAYQAVAVDDVLAGKYALNAGRPEVIFYPPEEGAALLPALEAAWPQGVRTATFTTREGKPIGAAASNYDALFGGPGEGVAVLADSYLRPVAWPALLLLAALVLAAAVRRPRGTAPASLPGRLITWLSAPIAILPMEAPQPALAPPANAPAAAPPAPTPAMPAAELPSAAAAPAPAAEPYRPLLEIEFHLRVNWPPSRKRRPKAEPGAGRSPRRLLARVGAWLDGAGAAPASTPPTAKARTARNSLDASLREVFGARAGLVALAGLLATAAMLAGQRTLIDFRQLQPGVNDLLAAAGVFLLVAWMAARYHGLPTPDGHRPAANGDPAYLLRSRDLRQSLIYAALGLAGLGFVLLTTRPLNAPAWDVSWIWLASMALYLLAALPRPTHKLHLPSFTRWGWELLALLGVIGLAAALRFYRLGEIPLVMENDEGIVGMRALAFLRGDLQNIFTTYRSYGTLHFYLMSLPVSWLGQTRFALRLLTAIAGVAAVPVVYWLARSLFGRTVALAAAALLAVAHVAVHFSRVSPAASSLDPLFFTLSLALLYHAVETRRPQAWVTAGLVAGVSLYFYTGARAIPVAMLAFLAGLLILDRAALRGNWRGLLAMAGAYAIAAAPIAAWALRFPSSFNERINQSGLIQSGRLAAEMAGTGRSALAVLAVQLKESLLIFNYHPVTWFYNTSLPMLGLLTGGLFVLGLAYGLAHLRDRRFLLLNAWFWATLITGQVLAVDPGVSAYRTLGLLPAACILAALALVQLVGILALWLGARRRWLVIALIVAALASEAGWNVDAYFNRWAPRFAYSDVKSRRASLIGDALAGMAPGTRAYLIGTPEYNAAGWSSLNYLRGATPVVGIDGALDAALAGIPRAGRLAFIFIPERFGDVGQVQAAFPGGSTRQTSVNGEVYFVEYDVGPPG